MSTSVQQTMEDVALKPAAVTHRAASRVPVKMDTSEMDLPVLVSQFQHVLSMYFSRLSMSTHMSLVLQSWTGVTLCIVCFS